jgi:hypothetical protein
VPATDGWNSGLAFPAPGSTMYSTGRIECSKQLQECTQVWCSNTSSVAPYACDTQFGSCSGLAQCRALNASDQWTSITQWAPSGSAYYTDGEIECAKQDQECVMQYCTQTTGGLPYSCTTQFGSCGGLARCRPPASGDGWTSHVVWPTGSNTTGNVECAKQNKVCATEYCTNTTGQLEYSCGTELTSCSGLAKCRALTGSDPWTTHTQWSLVASSGNAQCAAIGLTCYGAYSTADGSTQACATTFGSSAGGVALCK